MNKRLRVGPTELVVRTRVVKTFGVEFPDTACVLFNWVLSHSRKLDTMSFSVPLLPPTVNHQYAHQGGRRILTDEARAFREIVAIAVAGRPWVPRCPVMAMVFLESPHWITKRHTLRDMDCDNRLKPLFDAIQNGTRAPDCTNWEIHSWKVASAFTRTTVYLFALGDLIDWHP